jgi:transposase
LNLELLKTLSRACLEQEWLQLAGEKERLELTVKLLQEALRLARIEKFGPKSEKLTDGQLELLESEPGVAAGEIETEAERREPEQQAVEKQRLRQHPGRQELPAHLPRRETLIACTPEQCRCAQCGGEKQIIGYDSSEELDVEPTVYFVRVTKLEKRACKQCEEMGVSTAPAAGPKIVEKSKASNRIIVDVVIDKYVNHLPLYRQSAIFERNAGVELSRMTLCGWVMRAGTWLQAISAALRGQLLAGDYIQADETPVGVQSARTRGKNHQAYLWEYSLPGGPVVFDFQMGRSREGPRKFLGDFGGILQSDGYAAYDRIGGQGIVFAGCWAHVRRGFVDALKVAPEDAKARAILAEIGRLYAVEKEAREGGFSPAQRRELRQEQSAPVLVKVKEKLVETRGAVLPQSALGKACDYGLGQWPRLTVYAEHGEVEIDQNWCENAMRPIALGRKNWLHIGSEEAGPRVAAIASVTETCRRLGINVREYLLDVLPRIADWPAKRIGELTPAAWLAARARPQPESRPSAPNPASQPGGLA